MTGDRDPRLLWTEAGEPRSGLYDDVYFSAEDGLAESRAVFLSGCGLPEAWQGRDVFTVAELGFGTGLNVVALLDLWRRAAPPGGRLHVFSVEAHPMTAAEAARALAAWPEVAEVSAALLARWPATTPGCHRIDLPEMGATLDLTIGDAAWALDQWTGRADAWFLDGFSPATNPAMWSDAVLDAVAARSAPGARLATFTVAGAVRRGLATRGFEVDKRPGHGRKRERLEAIAPGSPPSRPRPTVAVIGAGIAGAALIRALKAAGADPVLIEADAPGAGGSGFPSALVTPRFDLGDTAVAALFAQALERARALYAATDGATLAEGVRQLPATDRERDRFARVAAQPIWPEAALIAEADGSLTMARALTVSPSAILSAWLAEARTVRGEVAAMVQTRSGWSILSTDGETLAEANRVVFAAGWGLARLASEIAVAPVRGQADWTVGATAGAMAWGGYVAPTADGFLFGATHDRGQTMTEIRPEDSLRNLQTLARQAPDLAARAEAAPRHARAAVRATTRDRLPLAGAVPDRPGLFVLGGLGSRGFCLAPLLAEHVAALILERPSPLPIDIARRVDPGRPATLAPPRAEGDDGPAIPEASPCAP